MELNAAQLGISMTIDAKVGELVAAGSNDAMIFIEMMDHMNGFKLLLGSASKKDLDELCAQFGNFRRYAQILENVSAAIKSGEIKLPQ